MKRLLPLLLLLAPAASFAQEPASAAPQARLHWSAVDGERCYGYLIYRATDRQGPFLRINREIVPTPRDGQKEHAYDYVDTAVENGATYYYYLDYVDDSGVKHRFSGVLSKTVAAPVP